MEGRAKPFNPYQAPATDFRPAAETPPIYEPPKRFRWRLIPVMLLYLVGFGSGLAVIPGLAFAADALAHPNIRFLPRGGSFMAAIFFAVGPITLAISSLAAAQSIWARRYRRGIPCAVLAVTIYILSVWLINSGKN